MSEQRILIIGGGFGGLYAAKSLKRAEAQITLVDKRNFHLFQPLLYQVATGTLSTGNIAAALRSILKRQKNAQVLLGEMVNLDPANKKVILKDGEVSYDTLIIAAGSEPYYLRHDNWRPLAPGLKTVEDAISVRSRILRAFEAAERESDPAKIREWLTFVIVGAGPTGVELAGALAEVARKTLRNDFRKIDSASATIIMANGLDRALPEYPKELSERAEAGLRKLGITIRNKTFVTDVQPDCVYFGDGPERERVPTRTVLWAAGVRASPLGAVIAKAVGATLDREGRVIVEKDLTLAGHPEIFIIGDLASVKNRDGKVLPGVAPVAIQEGRFVADLIQARLKQRPLPEFHYRHHGNLATIGRNHAVADLGWIRFNGILAWLAWAFLHLMYIVEFEDRVLVLVQWAWNYVTWSRSDLLITYTQDKPS